jgi:DNA-binding NtrC family response regulator
MTQAVSRPIALVVEADREERALVCTLLEESDMQVIECDSAEAALAVVERKGGQMAMVFTDVGLAGRMDGVALAHHPGVPVVVISAQRSRRIDDRR